MFPEEESAEPSRPERRELRFAYVSGVTPGKWIRRWEERMPEVPLHSFLSDDGGQLAVLRDGSADLSFVRLPVDGEGLSIIPLYEEQPAVVAPKGHEISVFEEVALEDLSDETFLDVEELGGADIALQVVASGVGLVILPMPVARHLNNKETVARRLTGAPATRIGLAWPSDSTDSLIEEFVGIVRGRTAQSSRQPSAQQEKPKKAPMPDRRGTGTGKGSGGKSSVPQRYAPNPDKGRGRGSRKKGRR
ncbi:LysR family transcriptional regulator substrate-binding protein [Arthrobacter sp. ISL-30]|uniref:LysR family transcriptional regulator substrate-binding protein n=1 Tax=Arthrobacter sp. ISL-30 TaxID=2819109 RepID=UPI001BEBBA77|nr:LysR family transcriptional regulator substrate-binding protein [Arthrobacter sp. ISL-30]MBT2514913.1 LysR family transcriptional regulator substrate-binding protein [Arthrobacter sp. ISL-30]